MSCPGHCFAFVRDKVTQVNHLKKSGIGTNWYFCPVHRAYHSIFLGERVAQPLCGECAVVFFAGNGKAIWFSDHDVSSITTDSDLRTRDAWDDMDELLREISEERRLVLSLESATAGDFVVEDAPLIQEIPMLDETYIGLGNDLIPHPKSGIADLYLMPFITFEGVNAFQPCSINIDLIGLFKPLEASELDADPVFQQARTWSCIVQARARLPKPLRWILATIYNFSNEMLRKEVDEDTLWKMRSWLLHWYKVADEFMKAYGIDACSPEPDWFSSPKPSNVPRSRRAPQPTSSARQTGSPHSSSSSSSAAGDGTVIHHQVPHRQPLRSSVLSSDIFSWLQSQPGHQEEYTFFDPTPRGNVLRKPQRREFVSSLNPRAAPFIPESSLSPPSDSGYESDAAEKSHLGKSSKTLRARTKVGKH
ncbi:hypothetical protein CP533_3392 [Ophiocordyceps camponoti-saundersi (nom. inval.)]|nr:hypothetical protein CP533_3392 [Ophiocordyceps camponoti-saundersi (nom. inval.)]